MYKYENVINDMAMMLTIHCLRAHISILFLISVCAIVYRIVTLWRTIYIV